MSRGLRGADTLPGAGTRVSGSDVTRRGSWSQRVADRTHDCTSPPRVLGLDPGEDGVPQGEPTQGVPGDRPCPTRGRWWRGGPRSRTGRWERPRLSEAPCWRVWRKLPTEATRRLSRHDVLRGAVAFLRSGQWRRAVLPCGAPHHRGRWALPSLVPGRPPQSRDDVI